MENQEVMILGKRWTIKVMDVSDADGKCQFGIREIWIADDIDERAIDIKAVIRHEIIHAFMFESGLGYNFEWDKAQETIVDWFALQYPKISKVFKKFGVDK